MVLQLNFFKILNSKFNNFTKNSKVYMKNTIVNSKQSPNYIRISTLNSNRNFIAYPNSTTSLELDCFAFQRALETHSKCRSKSFNQFVFICQTIPIQIPYCHSFYLTYADGSCFIYRSHFKLFWCSPSKINIVYLYPR